MLVMILLCVSDLVVLADEHGRAAARPLPGPFMKRIHRLPAEVSKERDGVLFNEDVFGVVPVHRHELSFLSQRQVANLYYRARDHI